MDDIRILREKLGVTHAPRVDAGLAATMMFFRMFVQDDPATWWRYLRGIDFHKRVEITYLQRGKSLIRYDSTGERTLKPFAFYTDPGVSPYQLGTSFPASQYKLFTVVTDTPALVSKASSISFDPQDHVSRIGGGTQYIIAFAHWPKLLRVADPKGT